MCHTLHEKEKIKIKTKDFTVIVTYDNKLIISAKQDDGYPGIAKLMTDLASVLKLHEKEKVDG